MTGIREQASRALAFVCSLILSGCSLPAVLPTPTSALPSSTPSPIPTPTATQPPSPTPRPTRTPLSKFEFTGFVHFEHAGFAYPRVANYAETYRPLLVVLSSEDQEVLIGLAGGVPTEDLPLVDLLENFLANMARDIETFKAGDPMAMTVQGAPALGADISGILLRRQVAGRVVYASVSPGQFFVIFGNAPPDRWAFEGLPLYGALLEGIEFFEPTPLRDSCPISADRAYGYTAENPIRVGPNDFFNLAAVEREYLDLLSGPNSEAVTYERRRSITTEDTILDEYLVSYPGRTLSLFLDAYSGEPFRVPAGLSCAQ